MFKKAQHIDSAFKLIRGFSVVLVIATLCICGFALYENHLVTQEANRRIFILANGKALEAFAADRKDNIPVEARDHITMFHHDFFTLDPDEKVITENISRALYLADASAKKQYDNLKEKGYYSSLISGNISQHIHVDSIDVNINAYPYYFRCRATEKIIRTTSILTRSLTTEGYLRNVERSDNNPHGFLIERWTILENRDLKTETR
ncbi:MAG TPA: conjugative transposon protein TraK [Puia sp.]|nr:conjugative transposon protein TraK [Puia sp.]